MRTQGFSFEGVTLHVGAGTFLPVKTAMRRRIRYIRNISKSRRSSVGRLLEKWDNNTAVGTTSVRTLESLAALAWRIRTSGAPDASRVIGQWELYDLPEVFTGREALPELSDYMVREGIEKLKAATQIMITPLGYRSGSCAISSRTSTSPNRRCCCWCRLTWEMIGIGFTTTPSRTISVFELQG